MIGFAGRPCISAPWATLGDLDDTFGARRVDERTVAVTYPSLAEREGNLGEICAPEAPTCAADMRQPFPRVRSRG